MAYPQIPRRKYAASHRESTLEQQARRYSTLRTARERFFIKRTAAQAVYRSQRLLVTPCL
ncbi:hypothetical protein PSAC2689_240020 [Paraburkholderia sacchari]